MPLQFCHPKRRIRSSDSECGTFRADSSDRRVTPIDRRRTRASGLVKMTHSGIEASYALRMAELHGIRPLLMTSSDRSIAAPAQQVQRTGRGNCGTKKAPRLTLRSRSRTDRSETADRPRSRRHGGAGGAIAAHDRYCLRRCRR